MTKRMEFSPAGTPMIVEYLHDNPPPRMLNTFYLLKMGFAKGPNNSYIHNDITIKYDGVKWHYFHQAAAFEIETVEELEKLLA